MIIVNGIDINIDSAKSLKEIIKRLTIGEEYYFHFRREDFFLTDEEIGKFRYEIPI